MRAMMMQMPLTIQSLLDHAARYHGQTPVISVETTGGIARANWEQVSQNSHRLASSLSKLGLSKGARCATIAWNNIRHLEIYFGVPGAGLVCHTINPRLFAEQLIYVINHAQDQVLFFDKTFLPAVAKLREHLPSVQNYILMGPRDEEAAKEIDGLLFYDDFIAEGDQDFPWAEISENDASSLCYTSGTTGNPKGTLYSHRSTVLHTLSSGQPDALNLSARDIVLPVVPMFHVNAWGVPYIAAMNGSSLVLPGPGLDGDSLAQLIEQENVTVALGVPTIWQGLLLALGKRNTKPKHFKRTVIGGAACPPSMIAEFADKYDVEVIHAWGMTEMSPVGTVNTLLAKHAGLSKDEQAHIRLSQGRPVFGVELKIIDDSGALLPNDGFSEGQLLVRGHWIIQDYYEAPDVQTLQDGWFDTGDIATIDPDGYMVIRDRSKDIIKSGGEWISSVELEGIAVGHPKIADAAAIAAKHQKWGERPVLLLVKTPDSDISEQEILEFVGEKVAKWQIPDRAIFVDQLPRNATGKILKKQLREEYGNVLIT